MIKKGKKKLQQPPDKLDQEFGDKVIVVGNSSNIKDTNYGAIIDKFGTVIRVNKYHVKGYEPHTGRKTDIWVKANPRGFFRDTKEWKSHLAALKEIVICCAPHVARDEAESELKYYKDKYPNNNVDMISYDLMDKYHEDAPWPNENKWPSTGLVAIQWAIERYGKVYIHGFDFFEPHDYTDPFHYYEDCKAGYGKYHLPILEKMCVSKYMCQGKLEFLNEDDKDRLFPKQKWSVDKLIDRQYVYYRKNMQDIISHTVNFGSDGKIHGYRNAKEHAWSLEGEYLLIKDTKGIVTSVYRHDEKSDMFRGFFLSNCTKHFLQPKKEAKKKALMHPSHKKWTGDVIVVANSSLIMNNEYGEEIDKFNRVVRLNRFFTQHYEKGIDYRKHIGSKTSVWIRNELTSFKRTNKVWNEEIDAIDRIVIVAPRGVIRNRRDELKRYWSKVYPENRVDVIQESTIDNMYFHQNWPPKKWPSTGLMALEYMLERFDKVHIYGFDFFGYGKNKATHYYNDAETIPDWKRYHIAKLEYDYAMKYVKAGRLILWKDYLGDIEC